MATASSAVNAGAKPPEGCAMPVIGIFKPTKAGGWEGRIHTLTINLCAKFVPNDDRRSESSPDFIVTTSGCQIGIAWKRLAGVSPGRTILNVKLDDPCLPSPVLASLFSQDDNQVADLVWNSKRSANGE